VSPIGIGLADFWKSLSTGASGVRSTQRLQCAPPKCRLAAEVLDFNPSTFTKTREQKKAIRVMCREIQLGFAAASLALDDAGIGDGQIDPDRLGVEFGANLMLSPPEDLVEANAACFDQNRSDFDYDRWGEMGLGAMFPLWLLKFLPNM